MSQDFSNKGVQINLSGAALPTSYPSTLAGVTDPQVFFIGASPNAAVDLKVTFDANSALQGASNGIGVKLVKVNAVDGSGLCDLQTTREDLGTSSNEQVIQGATGSTVYVTLETGSQKLAGQGLLLLARAIGGAPLAGDSVQGVVLSG